MLLKTNTVALIATIMLVATMVAQTGPESARGPVTAGMLPPKGGMIAMRFDDMDTPNVKVIPFC